MRVVGGRDDARPISLPAASNKENWVEYPLHSPFYLCIGMAKTMDCESALPLIYILIG